MKQTCLLTLTLIILGFLAFPYLSLAISLNEARSAFTRDLSLGDQGADVAVLNSILSDFGFGSASDNPRFFSPATKTALSAFQSHFGIIPSIGYFGPVTRDFILNRLTAQAEEAGSSNLVVIVPPPAKFENNISPNAPRFSSSSELIGASLNYIHSAPILNRGLIINNDVPQPIINLTITSPPGNGLTATALRLQIKDAYLNSLTELIVQTEETVLSSLSRSDLLSNLSDGLLTIPFNNTLHIKPNDSAALSILARLDFIPKNTDFNKPIFITPHSVIAIPDHSPLSKYVSFSAPSLPATTLLPLNSKPIITVNKLPESATSLRPGFNQTVYNFSVTARGRGSLSLYQIPFDLSASLASLTEMPIKNLRLYAYQDQSLSAPLAKNGNPIAAESNRLTSNSSLFSSGLSETVHLIFSNPLVLQSGDTVYFKLVGDIKPFGTDLSVSLLNISLNSDLSATSPDDAYRSRLNHFKSHNTSSALMLWSDNLNKISSLSDSAWLSGRFLDDINVSSLSQPLTLKGGMFSSFVYNTIALSLPSISITSDSDSFNWTVGAKETITWTTDSLSAVRLVVMDPINSEIYWISPPVLDGSKLTFTVPALPSGSYRLYLSTSGHSIKSDIKNLTINPAAPLSLPSIAGTVVDESNIGLPDITVLLQGQPAATTDQTGRFTISNIDAGYFSAGFLYNLSIDLPSGYNQVIASASPFSASSYYDWQAFAVDCSSSSDADSDCAQAIQNLWPGQTGLEYANISARFDLPSDSSFVFKLFKSEKSNSANEIISQTQNGIINTNVNNALAGHLAASFNTFKNIFNIFHR